ncbi:MAG: hypothetical protein IMZ53_14650 [Thermoplasmata archaeon]|nr:hypothetical protein [Thermoplasmata archaeon]
MIDRIDWVGLQNKYEKEGKPFIVRFDFTNGVPEELEILSSMCDAYVVVKNRDGVVKEIYLEQVISKRDVTRS